MGHGRAAGLHRSAVRRPVRPPRRRLRIRQRRPRVRLCRDTSAATTTRPISSSAPRAAPPAAVPHRGREPVALWKGTKPSMYDVEHQELFAAIRAGKPINNGDYMVRAPCWPSSRRWSATPARRSPGSRPCSRSTTFACRTLSWDAEPPIKPDPDGKYPMAMPGMTKFVPLKKDSFPFAAAFHTDATRLPCATASQKQCRTTPIHCFCEAVSQDAASTMGSPAVCRRPWPSASSRRWSLGVALRTRRARMPPTVNCDDCRCRDASAPTRRVRRSLQHRVDRRGRNQPQHRQRVGLVAAGERSGRCR